MASPNGSQYKAAELAQEIRQATAEVTKALPGAGPTTATIVTGLLAGADPLLAPSVVASVDNALQARLKGGTAEQRFEVVQTAEGWISWAFDHLATLNKLQALIESDAAVATPAPASRELVGA